MIREEAKQFIWSAITTGGIPNSNEAKCLTNKHVDYDNIANTFCKWITTQEALFPM